MFCRFLYIFYITQLHISLDWSLLLINAQYYPMLQICPSLQYVIFLVPVNVQCVILRSVFIFAFLFRSTCFELTVTLLLVHMNFSTEGQ